MKTTLFISVLVGFIQFVAMADEPYNLSEHRCFEPGRVAYVCLTMHHLRSHVQLIEQQRDMLRSDYTMLKNIGNSMEQAIAKLMVSRHYNEHLRAISDVRAMALRLKGEAIQQNFQALRTANLIKQRCQSCHSLATEETPDEERPSWKEVFAMDWDSINKRCNSEGRNPYVCKHMFGMSTMFSYFESAYLANEFDFELAESAASELLVLAEAMMQISGGAHEDGVDPFITVKNAATELKQLAAKRDPYVYQRSQTLSQACDSCHARP